MVNLELTSMILISTTNEIEIEHQVNLSLLRQVTIVNYSKVTHGSTPFLNRLSQEIAYLLHIHIKCFAGHFRIL
jgi:hypothetical protein